MTKNLVLDLADDLSCQLFKENLPGRPFCANTQQKQHWKIREAENATTYKYIQANTIHVARWMYFDVPHEDAAQRCEHAQLPPPTLCVSDPKNGHAHFLYGLQEPVYLSLNARQAPINYMKAIKTAFIAKLHATPDFSMSLVRNPLHPGWSVKSVSTLYSLRYLAQHVCLPHRARFPLHPTITPEMDCREALFDPLRQRGYTWVLHFKNHGWVQKMFTRYLLAEAQCMNTGPAPFSAEDLKALADDVSKWIWQKFTVESFSAIQSRRGKKGGRPRKYAEDAKPWRARGISRATYYRHCKSGILVPATAPLQTSSSSSIIVPVGSY